MAASPQSHSLAGASLCDLIWKRGCLWPELVQVMSCGSRAAPGTIKTLVLIQSDTETWEENPT